MRKTNIGVWGEVAKYGRCSPVNPECRLRHVLDGEVWCETHQRYLMREWEAVEFLKKKGALASARRG